MAFSKTPTMDTYSSDVVPTAYNINLRFNSFSADTSTRNAIAQDEGMINLFPYKDKDTLKHACRPGMINIALGNAGDIVRGFYVWEKDSTHTYWYVVIGTKIYTSADNVTYTNVTTLLTNVTTPVRFTEYIDATNTKQLILVDGIEGYIFTTNAAGTKIVDVDFPSPHVPFPIFMDGYLFLAKANTGDIYNSDLNAPSSWTPGNFISSELYPDDVQALVKVDNYLVAVGTQGCEYFYDAGNASGSPLARQEGMVLPFGTSVPTSIAYTKNGFVMLANMNDGLPAFVTVEGSKYKVIDAAWLIDLFTACNGATSLYTACRGFLFRYNGMEFYGFRLNGTTNNASMRGVAGGNGCFVYSFNSEGWTEFRMGTNNEYVYGAFLTSPVTVLSNGYYYGGTWVAGIDPYSTKPFVGKMVPQAINTVFDRTNDGGTLNDSNVLFEVRTPNLDFGTLNLKTMFRLGVYPRDGYPYTDVPILVSWNDYDYDANKWTTDQTLTYNSATTSLNPFIRQLGSFRRRAFRFRWSGYPLVLDKVEVSINKGMQ